MPDPCLTNSSNAYYYFSQEDDVSFSEKKRKKKKNSPGINNGSWARKMFLQRFSFSSFPIYTHTKVLSQCSREIESVGPISVLKELMVPSGRCEIHIVNVVYLKVSLMG